MFENDVIKRYSYFILMVNFAILFTAAMGIFPINADTAGLNVFDDLRERIDRLSDKFTNASNTFEYMVVIATLIINGLIIMFYFIYILLGGLPIVLIALGMPPAIAGLLIMPVIAMVLYEIAVKMTRIG